MKRRIGQLQSIPAERVKTEGLELNALYTEFNILSGKLNSVTISNGTESGEKITHEIRIKGMDGYVCRALEGLIKILKEMKSIEDKIDAKMMQEAEKIQNEEGILVIRVPGFISKKDTPERRLQEYDIKVRRSRYDMQDVFFVVKGSEKEDIAIEPPFNIEVENGGDFIFVSKENLQPLIEELQAICQYPS